MSAADRNNREVLEQIEYSVFKVSLLVGFLEHGECIHATKDVLEQVLAAEVVLPAKLFS
jgi:hypothetical protein